MTFAFVGLVMAFLLIVFIAAVGTLVGSIGWGIVEEDKKAGCALFIVSMLLFWLFFSVIAWLSFVGA